MTEELKDLRDRVAKLTGPHVRIDEEVALLMRRLAPAIGQPRGVRYTESIDAVEGLRQHVLPGWRVTSWNSLGPWACSLTQTTHKAGAYIDVAAAASTEPLARLLALLDALIAQGEGG